MFLHFLRFFFSFQRGKAGGRDRTEGERAGQKETKTRQESERERRKRKKGKTVAVSSPILFFFFSLDGKTNGEKNKGGFKGLGVHELSPKGIPPQPFPDCIRSWTFGPGNSNPSRLVA